MIVEVLLFFGTLSLALYLWFRYKSKKNEEIWAKHGIPKVSSNIFTVIFGSKNLIEKENDMYREIKVEHGKKFGIFMEFTSPRYVITDLDILKSVSIKDVDHFTNRRRFNFEYTDPHMHFGVGNQEGETWKNLRSKITPAFTTGRIRRMFPIIESSSKRLMETLKNHHSDEVDVREFLPKLLMDVIARVGFGLDTNVFSDPNSEFNKFGQRIKDLFKFSLLIRLVISSAVGPRISALLRLKILDREADQFFTNVVLQTLSHREKTGEVRDDFLQLMLEARAKSRAAGELDKNYDASSTENLPMNDDVILAQCFFFFLGGVDTVESALIFCLHSLATNPDVQEKLFEELRDIHEKSENGEFDYDSIQNAEYLDMVLSESLRMYPPTPRTEKRCSKPYKMPDSDFVIQKDELIIVPILGIHRDPEIWPEPEKFNPLRFTKEENAKRHACAYQPFGVGPRNCVANRFALTECKAVIAHTVLNFQLSPCSKTDNPPQFAKSAILKPKNGMWIKITPRNQ